MCIPPSTMKTPPVEKVLWSEARKSTIRATSSARPCLPSGMARLSTSVPFSPRMPVRQSSMSGLELVLDGPGGKDVHADAPRGDFLGHHSGQADESMLGGGVGGHARVGSHPHDAGGDDDAPAVVHMRQTVLAGQERAAHVRSEDGVEDILRVLGHRADDPGDAGVAEQHVYAAPALHCRLDVCPGIVG